VDTASGARLRGPLVELTSGQQEVLRWVAIVTMVVDHVGAVLVPPAQALPLRAVGRVAWPLFAFLLAYNVARRGVDPRRYLAPLLVWCAVSTVPHYLAFERPVVNILGTLFLGAAVLALLTRREELEARSPLLLPAGLAAALVASAFVEYGPPGVALVVAWWWALRTGEPASWLVAAGLVPLQNYPWAVWPATLAALPLPFVVARLPVGLPRSGRLPWLFYPAHLAVLAAIARLLG